MRTTKKKSKKRWTFTKKIRKSPINYWSDLFIVAMVIFWIFDNILESIVASIVTVSSIILSFQTGSSCYDTTMWQSIGTNIAMPLSAGGAVWMIKNTVVHAITNNKGKQAEFDFPAVDGTEEADVPNDDINESEPVG